MPRSSFPGGTSVSLVDIYADAAPDGVCGGSPHMHLVSTEAYVVVAGRGALQTIDASGFQETPLTEGVVVWFTPGTIHRAVNHDGLRVAVLMSNAGLPEAGDAVLTFPADVLADPEAYARAADLGAPEGRAERAARRRDLAVAGFADLRMAVEAGDGSALAAFHEQAGRLVRERSKGWGELVAEGPLALAQQSLDLVRAVEDGDARHLSEARVRSASTPAEPGYGMCGRLRPFDVSD